MTRQNLLIPEIETRASRALARVGAFKSPRAIPVHEVAQAMKLTIEPATLGDGVSGVLVVSDGQGVIGINRSDGVVRQRFTIAHEIGHFDLHRTESELFIDKKFSAFFRDSKSARGVDRHEVEANAFAAALLMPRKLVEHAFKESDGFDLGDEDDALTELATLFQVSKQAMTFRLSNLGLLTPA